MNNGNSNIFYHPEDEGLVLIGSLDEPNMSYEYNTLIVLEHTETKRLFWAHDSGCSCPTPFEDYKFRSTRNDSGKYTIDTDMSEIHPGSFDAFETEVRAFPCSLEDQMELLWKVKHMTKVA